MAASYEKLLSEIDSQIRAGQFHAAREQLHAAGARKIPRLWAWKFARLSWRLDQVDLGIRLLGPVVRPNRRIPKQPEIEEIAEYAQCLIRVGAVVEAMNLLEPLDSRQYPEVDLYLASAYVSQWDYQNAMGPLKRYHRANGLSNYDRMVAKVNLAAACVVERQFDRSTPLLREVLFETSLQKFDLLRGVALEISAQNFLGQKKLGQMKRCIEEAQNLIGESPAVDSFFVKKWGVYYEVLKEKKSPPLSKLNSIREEARDRGHWETIRQCDEVELRVTREPYLFSKLFFGTSFPAYRERLTAQLRMKSTQLSEEHEWKLGTEGGEVVSILKSGSGVMRSGQLLYRLCSTLASDFYRPQRVAAIHFQLYPGEVYNPQSSPNRVYEAVKRFRQWAKNETLPITIEEIKGQYRLQATRPCSLLVPKEHHLADKKSPLLEEIRDQWADRAFSLKEAAKVLNLAERTLSRLLKEAVEEGRMQKEGKGRATRYRCAS